MRIGRRAVMAGAVGLASLGLTAPVRGEESGGTMYGLIGRMTATPVGGVGLGAS